MTTPVVAGPSGVARNAANWLPSAALSTRSSCETAAPEMTGIGGKESSSKHMTRRIREAGGVDAADERAIAEGRDERRDPGAAGAPQRAALDRAGATAAAARAAAGTGARAAPRPARAVVRQVGLAP